MNPGHTTLLVVLRDPAAAMRRLVSEPTQTSLGDFIIIGSDLEGVCGSMGVGRSRKNDQHDLIFTPTLMLWETLVSFID